jgi:hypothetical protein
MGLSQVEEEDLHYNNKCTYIHTYEACLENNYMDFKRCNVRSVNVGFTEFSMHLPKGLKANTLIPSVP